MTRKPQLYLYKHLRDQFKEELTQIKELFFERIEPVFSDTEGEANQYKEEMIEAAKNSEFIGELDDEKSDLSTWIMEESYERYTTFEIMKYRTLAMWISCMCQVWEQQISMFLKKDLTAQGLKIYNENNLVTVYSIKDVWDILKLFQVDVTTLQCWSKVKEMRQLVNVIKHGDGVSAEKLKRMRPDFFNGDNELILSGGMAKFGVSLLDTTLAISNQDFIEYYNALIQFWTELPERMYEK
ncbi:MAG: hypothetical protein K8R40_02705 [Anaerolineaceae bacterium]|nr:hypothetical protein [Anaerolineaceae bacterium]